MEAICGSHNRETPVAFHPNRRCGIGQRATKRVISGVIFKNHDAVLRAFGELVERINVTKRAAKVRPRTIRADVNVKPDFTIVSLG